jgi:hypothetical protein
MKSNDSYQAKPGSNYALSLRHMLVVFGVALFSRALYLFEASLHPDFNLFSMDQQYNLEWARALASGIWQPPDNMQALRLAYAAARAGGRMEEAERYRGRAEEMRTYGSNGVSE